MLRDFFRRIHILAHELREEHGQTMAEYGVVLSVICIAAIVAFGLLGTNISNVVTYVKDQLKTGP